MNSRINKSGGKVGIAKRRVEYRDEKKLASFWRLPSSGTKWIGRRAAGRRGHSQISGWLEGG